MITRFNSIKLLFNQYLLFICAFTASNISVAAIWEYRLAGELNYYNWQNTPFENCCILDGGTLELKFQIDDTIRIFNADQSTTIFPVFWRETALTTADGTVFIDEYLLTEDPTNQPLPSLLLSQVSANADRTLFQQLGSFSYGQVATIAHHATDFYDVFLPRGDFEDAFFPQLYWYEGGAIDVRDTIYQIDNQSFTAKIVPLPPSILFFFSAIGLLSITRNSS